MKTGNTKRDYRKDYDGDISTSRSDKYQYALVETPCSNDFLNSFTAPEVDRLSQEQIETLWDLEKQLELQMWHLIETNLSKHQIAVLHVQKLAIFQGEGQWWMAEQLNVNQSSIVKALQGNLSYCGGVVKRYGGIAKKLSNIIKTCPAVKSIMLQIESLEYEQVRLPHFKCFRKIVGTELQYQRYLKQQIRTGTNDHLSSLSNR